MSGSRDPPEEPFDALLDPAVLVGVWVDGTHVHRGRDAFAVDLVRQVPAPPQRVLVARTIVAPVVAMELREQLDDGLRAYFDWSMPEERE